MKYNMLTVISGSYNKHRQRVLLCRCDCGTEKVIVENDLKRGTTRSCGCLKLKCGEHFVTHGATKGRKLSSEYRVWQGMKTRCYNPRFQNYKYYGGRGIKICDQWKDSFVAFLKDMGPRPSLAHSLERKNVNGDYTPENCCWATATEQARNKRNTGLVEWNGVSMSMIELSQTAGVNYNRLKYLLNCGWTVQAILNAELSLPLPG